MKEVRNSAYYEYRPYRVGRRHGAEEELLLDLMSCGFERGFKSYWEQFGYEIGGPIAYGYTKWLNDEIEAKHPEITDIIFVARDGWLLQKIYERLPHTRILSTHYVYAPRILAKRCKSDANVREEYRKYTDSLSIGSGTVAVVDTATVSFSAQRLIQNILPNAMHGFYWAAALSNKKNRELAFSIYQTKNSRVVRYWSLIEFVLSSPEPPVMTMEGGAPAFKEATNFELEREAFFPEIESGVLRFVNELSAKNEYPQWSCDVVSRWVNDFLGHPAQEDIAAFAKVRVSANADHSDSIPMDPFAKKGLTAHELKNRLWLFSMRYSFFYKTLHNGNALRKRIASSLRGETKEQYQGGSPEKLAEQLDGYDLISFDVFDTLIVRSFDRPSELFMDLEKKNGIKGFHDLRIRAEVDAQANTQKPNREIDVFDIYNELAPRCGLDAKKAAQEEIEAEKRCSRADSEMLELCRLLREKNKRLIAVSDMYLPENTMRELLYGCGFDMLDTVYVSCSRGAAKENGELLRIARLLEGNPAHCVHIGDNLSADVQGGRKAGWETIWYRRQAHDLRGK